jgi:hypothetical protein
MGLLDFGLNVNGGRDHSNSQDYGDGFGDGRRFDYGGRGGDGGDPWNYDGEGCGDNGTDHGNGYGGGYCNGLPPRPSRLWNHGR